MTIRVNPCPVCGTESSYEELIWHASDDTTPRLYYLMCPSCEAKTSDRATPAEALNDWNEELLFD